MREIELTQGYAAIVDDEDYEYLSQFKWQSHITTYTAYAYRRVKGTNKHRPMHREVMGVTDPKIYIDHIDRNGLNNQRKNLRIVTWSQNQMNKTYNKRNSLGFKGVSFDGNKYIATIKVNGKQLSVGYYKTPKEAAIAYNIAAKEHFGEFAYLNPVDIADIVEKFETYQKGDVVKYVFKVNIYLTLRQSSLGTIKEVHEDNSYTVKFRTKTERLKGFQLERVTSSASLNTVKIHHR